MLKAFYRHSRVKPTKIIMFRDGVSEGQFQQVHTLFSFTERVIFESPQETEYSILRSRINSYQIVWRASWTWNSTQNRYFSPKSKEKSWVYLTWDLFWFTSVKNYFKREKINFKSKHTNGNFLSTKVFMVAFSKLSS